jgi:hypothetical protein
MKSSLSKVTLRNDELRIGRWSSINFQRTIRLPDDGRDYPLPPGLGRFPLRRVKDFAGRAPSEWVKQGGFLFPMHRHEALWLSFRGEYWHPVAMRVEVGGVCALTGTHDRRALSGNPQNYIVVPDQPWLDGIKAGEGTIRQFVAAPLGGGVTVEGQVTGAEKVGGLQITIVEPKPGKFPDKRPVQREYGEWDAVCAMVCEPSAALGIGAGGRMVQRIYEDSYGLDTWNESSARTINIRLVAAEDWLAITGEAPPPSPVSIDAYLTHGGPWFALADSHKVDLAVSPILAGVKPVPFDP